MCPQETDDDNSQDVTYVESGSKVSKDSSTSNIPALDVTLEKALRECRCMGYHVDPCPVRDYVSSLGLDRYFK